MQNKTGLTRRGFSLGLAAAPLVAMLPDRAAGLTLDGAKRLIDRLVADLNAIINSGKPETAMYGDFERFLVKYGDVAIIARSSMGIAWRSASANQRNRYKKAFQGYLARKYGKRFREFIGGQIVVTGAKQVKSGFLVNSVVHLAGQAPFTVDWQVSDKSGRDKMFNMYIEGISLLATERTEIAAMLDRRGGNIDKMIADLQKAS